MQLKNKKVVVIGGSSGIGKAIAKTAIQNDANVIIIGRSLDKLQQTATEIGGNIQTLSLDITDTNAVNKSFSEIGAIDHLVISGYHAQSGSFNDLDFQQAKNSFDQKFWAIYAVAKYAQVNSTGSIIFFSGLFTRKPSKGYSTISIVNGAIEAFARYLAIELSPIRVNVISPGLTDTPAYSGMPAEMRQAYFENLKNSLPAKKIGQSEDIANLALMMMTNTYLTGTIIDIDGGAMLT